MHVAAVPARGVAGVSARPADLTPGIIAPGKPKLIFTRMIDALLNLAVFAVLVLCTLGFATRTRKKSWW
jgi:hypothetical protein